MDIKFYLDNRPDKTGDCPIIVSLSTSGVRYRTTTGYKITPDKWDKDQQRVRRGTANATGLPYNVINAAMDKIRAHFGKMDDVDRQYTKNELETEYYRFKGGGEEKIKRRAEQAESPAFKHLLLQFMAEQGQLHGWTDGTVTKFKTLDAHIEAYKPGLKMSDINEDVLNGFVSYLINKGFKNNYIKKLSKILQWFLRWAHRKNHCSYSDFTPLNPKLKVPEKTVIFLEWEELMKLKDFPIPPSKQYLERVRDVFVFCCFTGLRYSDAQNLKVSDVKDNRIDIVTRKTTDSISIPLNKYSKAVLDKYAGEELPNDRALPTITNQKANTYLKELCKMAGINRQITVVDMRGSKRYEYVREKWELMGTHAGRRTFICAAIEMNIPIPTIMEITGHSDYNAMRPYIAIVGKSKKEAMEKFNQWL